VPLPRTGSARSPRSISLVEVGFWIAAAPAFDFATRALQLDAAHLVRDLGVSYHVGQFGFSLWLVGLTVVCGAARAATRGGRDASGRAPTSGCCSS
jgi:NADH:ubiquinone oxidoreductase subunit 4 (subunit M)